MKRRSVRHLNDFLKRTAAFSAAAAIMLTSTLGSVYGEVFTSPLPTTGPLQGDVTGIEQPVSDLPVEMTLNPEPVMLDPALQDSAAEDNTIAHYTDAEIAELKQELAQVDLIESSGLQGIGWEGGTELDPRFNVLLTPEEMEGVYVPTSAKSLYYRSLLSPELQQSYDTIMAMAERYNNSGNSATTNIGGMYAAVTVSLPRTLNASQLSLIFSSLVMDNPEYFWINSFSYSVTSDQIIFVLMSGTRYVNGPTRSNVNGQIKSGIAAITAEAMALGSDYEKVKYVHDALCERAEYAYDPFNNPAPDVWAHNIEGVFCPPNKAVCEGQAKAFLAAMNALGIEATIISGDSTSGPHAWNAVKLDGSWYLVDVTWDNQVDTTLYNSFLKCEANFGGRYATANAGVPPVISPTDYQVPESIEPAEFATLTITAPPVGTIKCYSNGVELTGGKIAKGRAIDIIYTPFDTQNPGELCINGTPTNSTRFYIYEDTEINVTGLQMIVKSFSKAVYTTRTATKQADGTYVIDSVPTVMATLGFVGSTATKSTSMAVTWDLTPAYSESSTNRSAYQQGRSFKASVAFVPILPDGVTNPDNITYSEEILFLGDTVNVTVNCDELITSGEVKVTQNSNYDYTSYAAYPFSRTTTFTTYKGLCLIFTSTRMSYNKSSYSLLYTAEVDGNPADITYQNKYSYIDVEGSDMTINVRPNGNIANVTFNYFDDHNSYVSYADLPIFDNKLEYCVDPMREQEYIENEFKRAEDTFTSNISRIIIETEGSGSWNSSDYDTPYPITWTVAEGSTVNVFETENDQYIDVIGHIELPDFLTDSNDLLPDEIRCRYVLHPSLVSFEIRQVGATTDVEFYNLKSGTPIKVEPIIWGANKDETYLYMSYGDILEIRPVDPADILVCTLRNQTIENNILYLNDPDYLTIPSCYKIYINATSRNVDHYMTINPVNIANGTDAADFGLPNQVTGYSVSGSEFNAPVTWDFTTYNRSRKDAHTFTIYGDVTVPATANADTSHKVVSTTVNVAAAENITDMDTVNDIIIPVKTIPSAVALGLPSTVTGRATDGTEVTFNATWDISNYDSTAEEEAQYTVTATLSAYGYTASNLTVHIDTVTDDATKPKITMDLTPTAGDDNKLIVPPLTKTNSTLARVNVVLPSGDTNRKVRINLPDAFGFASVGNLTEVSNNVITSVNSSTTSLDLVFSDTGAINVTFDVNLSVNKVGNAAGYTYVPGAQIPFRADYTATRGETVVNMNFVPEYALMKDYLNPFSFADYNSSFGNPSGYYEYNPMSGIKSIYTSAELINGCNSIYKICITGGRNDGSTFTQRDVIISIPMPEKFAIDTSFLPSGFRFRDYDSTTNTYTFGFRFSDECYDGSCSGSFLIYCTDGSAQDGATYTAAETVKIISKAYVGGEEIISDSNQKITIRCCTRSTNYSSFTTPREVQIPVVKAKDTIISKEFDMEMTGNAGFPKPEENLKVTIKSPEDYGAYITKTDFSFYHVDETTISNAYAVTDTGETINLDGATYSYTKGSIAHSTYIPVLPDDKNIVEVAFTIDHFDFHSEGPHSSDPNRSDLESKLTVEYDARQKDNNGDIESDTSIYGTVTLKSDNSAQRTSQLEIKYVEPEDDSSIILMPSINARGCDPQKQSNPMTYHFLISDNPEAVNKYNVIFSSGSYSSKASPNTARKLTLIPKEGLRINMLEMGIFTGTIPAVFTLDDNSTVSVSLTSAMKYTVHAYNTDKRYITKMEFDMTECCPGSLNIYPYGYLSSDYFLTQYPTEDIVNIFDTIPFTGFFIYDNTLTLASQVGCVDPSAILANLRPKDSMKCDYNQTEIPVSYPVDGYVSNATVNVYSERNFPQADDTSLWYGSDTHPDGKTTDAETMLKATYNKDFRMNLGEYEMKFKLADSFTYYLNSAYLGVYDSGVHKVVTPKNEYIDAEGFIHLIFDANSVFCGSAGNSFTFNFNYITHSDAVASATPVNLIEPTSFTDKVTCTSPVRRAENNGTEGAEICFEFTPRTTINVKANIFSYTVQGLSAYGYMTDSAQRGFGPFNGHGEADEFFRYVTKVRTDGTASFSDMTMYIAIPQLGKTNSTSATSYTQEWNALLTNVSAPQGYTVAGTTDENPSASSTFTPITADLSGITMLKITAASAVNNDEVTLTFKSADSTTFTGNPTAYMFTAYKYNGMAGDRTEYTRVVSYALSHYSVRYNLNGGSGTAPVDNNAYLDGDTVTPAAYSQFTRRGYTIKGWALTPDATTPITSCTINRADITLYAVWEEYNDPVLSINPETYSFSQRLRAQSSPAKTVTVTNTGLSDAPDLFVSINSTDFILNTNGMLLTLAPDESTTFTVTPKDNLDIDDYTVTATVASSNAASVTSVLSLTVTNSPKYRVYYDGNGADSGTVPVDARLYETGTRVDTLDGTNLRKDGKEFAGWATSPNSRAAVTTEYISGSDITFYAIWSDVTVTYKVIYSLNGGIGTRPADISGLMNGDSATLSDDTGSIHRENYLFKGWALTPASNVAVDSVTINNANVTVYAAWERDPANHGFSVSYHLNGGSGTTPVDNQEYNSDDTVTVRPSLGLTKANCTFGGWSKTQDNQVSVGSSFTITENTVLYAIWTPVTTKHKVTYNISGGTGTVPVDNAEYDTGADVTLAGSTGFSKVDYAFAGWALTPNGTPISGTTYTMGNSNVIFFALWQPAASRKYRVIYNANGGTGAVPVDNNEYTTNSHANVITQNNLTRDGFTFVGWSLTASGAIPVSTVTITNANVNLYAIWKINTPATIPQNPVPVLPAAVPTEPYPSFRIKTYKPSVKVDVAPEAGVTVSEELCADDGTENTTGVLRIAIVLFILTGFSAYTIVSKKRSR